MTDTSLDKLIQTLKTEAVESAEKESSKILEDARAEADGIIRKAEEKRERIIREAQSEAREIVTKGEAALRQAARDLNIQVRNEIMAMLGSVLESEVKRNFRPDIIKTALVKAIENVGGDVALKLSEEYEKELAEYIHEALRSKGKSIAVIKDGSLFDTLSITNTEEGWHYDITPQGIAETLQANLLSTWADILTDTRTE